MLRSRSEPWPDLQVKVAHAERHQLAERLQRCTQRWVDLTFGPGVEEKYLERAWSDLLAAWKDCLLDQQRRRDHG